MAYNTKGLGLMQVEDKDGNILTIMERTHKQIYNYLRTYIDSEELARYIYIEGSQFVSEYNGCIYALFWVDGDNVTLCVYDSVFD